MNYYIRPYWDTNMAIVFTLGNVSDKTLTSLAYKGVMTVTGAPDTVTAKWMKGALVSNEVDGTLYIMTGTPASPAWTLITGGGGGGITALTGDVTASGSGSVVATIANLAFSKLAALTSGHILVGSAGNVATSVAMSGDATIVASGALTIANNAITTVKILNANVTLAKLAPGTTGDIIYFNGTNWVSLPIGTAGQVLTVNGGGTAPSWV